ncbi:MAG: cation:proton antiporter [Clostridia bacterium]|nr:cation:proton antiporter [Clostridia bacterium]
MEAFEILLPLALILLLAKLMGLGTHRLGMPAVIGMLIAGILIGVLQFIPWAPLQDALFSDDVKYALKIMSKIGVVLIMFSAGLGTDLKKLKQTGVASVVITIFGIVVPMFLGWLTASLFFGFSNVLSNLFYGAILTATSVSVTVAVLKELGKLDSKVGTSIIAAAVIDDVIGIIILSVLTGFSSGGGENTGWSWFSPNAGMVVIKIVLFFVAAIGLGILLRMLFNVMERKSPHNRRVPIISLATCFLYSYLAEKIFGVADITGAYLAGILLGGTLSETPYVESKVDQMGYLFFSPIFFANIGIANIQMFSNMNLQFLAFGAVFVVAALLGKLLGCGVGAKISKFNFRDSFRVGLGMMVRAEVILICTEKGVACGLVKAEVYPFIILIILISSVLTPVFMKLSYRREEKLHPTLKTPKGDTKI